MESLIKKLIIIPAYNEALNIEDVVSNIQAKVPDYDFIIVNDGSTDNTAELCYRKEWPLLDLPVNLGLAGAFQAGMRYAYENKYDVAVQIDGDGQHDPAFIPTMLEEIKKTSSDVVIGSRFIVEKKPHTARMIGSDCIAFAIRLTTRTKLTDPTSGMRMFNRKMIRLFANNLNYGPEPDTLAYLLRNKVKIKEVQVTMHEREAGQSYLTVGKSIQYMINMFMSILLIQYFRPRFQK